MNAGGCAAAPLPETKTAWHGHASDSLAPKISPLGECLQPAASRAGSQDIKQTARARRHQ